MLSRLSAFVVWALVAATAVFWGLRLLARSPTVPPTAVAVGDTVTARVDLTRLLGAAPVAAAAAATATVETSARFQLLGIMAPRASAQRGPGGVALIAVDGKMARAYSVGAALDGDLVLQSVSLRSATLVPARGGPTLTLELPPLPVAATGTLMAPVPGGVVQPRPLMPAMPPQTVMPQGTPVPPPANPAGFIVQPLRDSGASAQ